MDTEGEEHCLIEVVAEENHETSVRIVSVLTEIQTRQLTSTPNRLAGVFSSAGATSATNVTELF
jgi:hypothetical protein